MVGKHSQYLHCLIRNITWRCQEVIFQWSKACTCLSTKWRNTRGIGGRTTGHFGTSITEQHITGYVFPPEEEIDVKNNTNDLLDTSVTQSGLRRIVATDMATQNTSTWINNQYMWYAIEPLKVITTNTTWQRRKPSRRTPTSHSIKNRTHQHPRNNILINRTSLQNQCRQRRTKNVLPSARTLNDYMQLLAVQPEADAANALFTMPSNVQYTLHYCTTSLCKIDGEWPSIIFSFSEKQQYVLGPIDFAYENCTQIISLLLETYKQLALVNGSD